MPPLMTTINAGLGNGGFLTLNGLALENFGYVLHSILALGFIVVFTPHKCPKSLVHKM